LKKNEPINYILVLPSWYPNKLSVLDGDFNERLVKATSSYKFQIVVCVSTKRNYKEKIKEYDLFIEKNVITYKAYYPFSKWFIVNVFLMIRLYLKIFKEIFKKYGLPQIVHTYVFLPAGIISLYLKYRYGLKTVLTEHWSFFNKRRSDNINKDPFYKKWVYKKILNSFNRIILVSKDLEESVSQWTPNIKKYIFPNVVDTTIFNREDSVFNKDRVFTFVHVSNMTFNKNVISIINCFKNVVEKGYTSKLILVGGVTESINSHLMELGFLKGNVECLGEIAYAEVAEVMKKSNAFVLFSYYENMPCVLLESLCCSLPIIASNVGGIPEVVNTENGILIESGNSKQLEDAMIFMINNPDKFDKQSISSKAINTYGYNEIGNKINNVYLELE
jgi:glycosyltransferase involved in cell wall biosynthesis